MPTQHSIEEEATQEQGIVVPLDLEGLPGFRPAFISCASRQGNRLLLQGVKLFVNWHG